MHNGPTFEKFVAIKKFVPGDKQNKGSNAL